MRAKFYTTLVFAMFFSRSLQASAQCATATAPVNVQNPTFASGTGLSSTPGSSCKGVSGNPSGTADPTGSYDSTCAVRNAAVYAASCSDAGALPPLYFPTGHYKFNVQGTSGVIVLNTPVGVVGDGPAASILENDSPNAALLTYIGVSGPSVTNLALEGNGSLTTGDLLDVISSQAGVYQHLQLLNTAGIGINLQGSSEQGRFNDLNAFGVRLPFNSEGNTNENYINGFSFTFDGQSGYNGNPDNNWHYDSNANPWTGIQVTTACLSSSPATWSSSTPYSGSTTVSYNGATFNLVKNNTGNTPQLVSQYWQECGQSPAPEERANVYLDGDNLTLTNGSIKGTSLSGVNLARTTSEVSHIYFEGPYNAAPPFYSYDTQVLGKQEVGHVTASVSSSSLIFPVDDAGWQHIYATDPTLLSNLATDNIIAVFPSDYLAGSTAQSTAVPALLRGQYELVNIAFAGDNPIYPGAGTGHATARAVPPPLNFPGGAAVAPGVACSGSQTSGCGAGPINAAVAYPAPSYINGVLTSSALIAQFPNSTYGVPQIQQNHMNLSKRNAATSPGVCNDLSILAPNAQWIGSPSQMCAENFAGAVPDGISVQIPGSTGYIAYPSAADYSGNSFYTDGKTVEAQGIGWIKIASQSAVTIDQSDGQLQVLPSLPSAFLTYINGNTQVQFVPWGGTTGNAVSASGSVTDSSAQVNIVNLGSLENPFNTYSAVASTLPGGSGPGTVVVDDSSNCTYFEQNNGSGAPTLRTCINPSTGLLTTQVYYANNWVNAPGTSHVFSRSAGNTGNLTLPAAPAGTVPGDGVVRASCFGASGSVGVTGVQAGGFQNPNTNPTTTLYVSPGLPPGVVYAFNQYGAGADPTNGVFGNYISITFCNTTSSPINITNSAMTITQIQ